jgi:hypothetical protein
MAPGAISPARTGLCIVGALTPQQELTVIDAAVEDDHGFTPGVSHQHYASADLQLSDMACSVVCCVIAGTCGEGADGS